jgi:glycosyltransferase involved in cell wall biosynthesis
MRNAECDGAGPGQPNIGPVTPIRVMIVVTDLEVGGAPLHLLRLVRHLPRERYCIKIVSLAPEGPVAADLRDAGVETAACGARSAADLRALVRLTHMVRQWRPDILHGLLFHANLAVRLVAPLAGVPVGRVVCEIHTVEIERPWHLRLDKLTIGLCRVELGISEAVVRHLRHRAHIPPHRLAVVEGGIELEPLMSAKPISRAEIGVPDDVPMLLWVGRLDPVKGFEELIAALAQLRARRDIRLVLVGDGDYRPTVEALIARHGVDEQVMLLGARRDVPALMAAADIFVFPSYTEGLPTVLLEAMASGIPIVTTDVAGCRDIVTHGQTGLIVPPRNAKALATAIETILDEPDRAGRLVETARRLVRERHGQTAVADRYDRLYRSILDP